MISGSDPDLVECDIPRAHSQTSKTINGFRKLLPKYWISLHSAHIWQALLTEISHLNTDFFQDSVFVKNITISTWHCMDPS